MVSKKLISYVMILLILMLGITPVMGDVSSAEIKEIKKALGLTDITISDSEFENILNTPVDDYEDSTLLDSARAITLEKNYIESLQKADLQKTIILLDATKDMVDSIDNVVQPGKTKWLGLGGEILRYSIGVPVIAMSWKNIRLHEMIYGSYATTGYVPFRDAGWNDDEAWDDVYSSTLKGDIDKYFKTDQDKKFLRELFRHAWILKQNPNYPAEVNDKAKILAGIIRERIPESRPGVWGGIFSAITRTIWGVSEKAIEVFNEYIRIPEAHSAQTTPTITPTPTVSPTLTPIPTTTQTTNPTSTPVITPTSTSIINSYELSSNGLQFIAMHEGFRSQLYNDAGDHCTIGYGHLIHIGPCNGGESAEFKAGITQTQGIEILNSDVQIAVNAVNSKVIVQLNKNQFDAMVSFTFNMGTGGFSGSTVLSALNAGKYEDVPTELNRYVKSGGMKIQGLVNRRKDESVLFMTPISTLNNPPPQITSISPTQKIAGIFDLTINGNNFDSGAIDQIYWKTDMSFVGKGILASKTGTKIISKQSMTGINPGVYVVKVKNSDGQLSNGFDFTIAAASTPAPQITSISPTQNVAGIFDLTINGNNFDSGAIDQIYWKSDMSFIGQGIIASKTGTRIVSKQSMTGINSGVYVVKIKNSDGQLSNGFDFTITAASTPAPQITSISPTQNVAGIFDLTINGNNFDSGAIDQIYWKSDMSFIGQGIIASKTGTRIVSKQSMTGINSGVYVVKVKNSDGQLSNGFDFTITAPISVQYQAHFANTGWMTNWAQGGQTAGTPGGDQMEAIKIKTTGYGITYRAHSAIDAWGEWHSDSAVAGTVGQGKSLQAIQIKLQNAPSNLHVYYRVYVQGQGWKGWVSDGTTAGTTGQALALEAIEIKIQS